MKTNKKIIKKPLAIIIAISLLLFITAEYVYANKIPPAEIFKPVGEKKESSLLKKLSETKKPLYLYNRNSNTLSDKELIKYGFKKETTEIEIEIEKKVENNIKEKEESKDISIKLQSELKTNKSNIISEKVVSEEKKELLALNDDLIIKNKIKELKKINSKIKLENNSEILHKATIEKENTTEKETKNIIKEEIKNTIKEENSITKKEKNELVEVLSEVNKKTKRNISANNDLANRNEFINLLKNKIAKNKKLDTYVLKEWIDNKNKIKNEKKEISRIEFLRIIRLAGNTESNVGGANFRDVPKNYKYYEEISWADANGIIKGEGNKFYPDKNLSKSEMNLYIKRFEDYLKF